MEATMMNLHELDLALEKAERLKGLMLEIGNYRRLPEQVTLVTFCEMFDYHRTRALELCKSSEWSGKISFKQGRQWYISIPAFLSWRQTEHYIQFRWA